MLSYLAKRSQYAIFETLNALKFYLQKLPIIRKIWKNDSFAMSGLKKFLISIWPIASLIINIVKKFIYFAFLLGVTGNIVKSHNLLNIGFKLDQQMAFLWAYAYFGIFNFQRFFAKEQSLIFYDLLKTPSRTIGLAEVFVENVIEMMFMTIIYYVFNFDLKFDLLLIAKIQIMYLMMRFVANYLNTQKLLKGWKDGRFVVFNIVFIIAMIVKDIVLDIRPEDFLSSWILFVVIVFLGLFAIFNLLKKVNYELVMAKALARYEQADVTTDTKKIVEKSIALKDEDFDKSKKLVDKKLEGYPLLNELFFQRHRRLIYKPIIIKASILFVLLGAFIGACLIWGMPDDFEKFIDTFPAYLPFVCYLVFYNETITRTMFVNCDEAFLQYDFYNRPKDLLEMFALRLKKLLKWNSLGLIVLGMFFAALVLLFEVSPRKMLINLILVISLWIFFNVHTLFLYYIFQPYNDKYEAKHPVYTIINIVVYILSYMLFQIAPSGPLLAPIFIAITIAYSAVALSLVYRVSPKTFVLRMRK